MCSKDSMCTTSNDGKPQFSLFEPQAIGEKRRKKDPSKVLHHHQLSNFGKVIDRILDIYRFCIALLDSIGNRPITLLVLAVNAFFFIAHRPLVV